MLHEQRFTAIEKARKMRNTALIISLLLVIITSAVYAQVADFEFIDFDDMAFIVNNEHIRGGITTHNIIWSLTSVVAEAVPAPITLLSHMIDFEIYGMNPQGHHLTNVVFHIMAMLLIFAFFKRFTGKIWQSAFVAALFALHPMHVESVAWVSERKDVLSAFFWFISLLFYAEFVTTQKKTMYILSLFSFIFGLMAKPMLVTLPLIMLLIDFWPLDRYLINSETRGVRLITKALLTNIIEKIPFFACSLLSGAAVVYTQKSGGTLDSFTSFPLSLRIENALISYVKYVGKSIWPQDLAILYPMPSSLPFWQAASSLLILLTISILVIKIVRRCPYIAVGWFWFIITLVPVIGLVKVGSQSMADRYSYIPMTGLLIIAAWGVPELTKCLKYRYVILALFSGVIIITSALRSHHQIGYWKDSITLFRHALKITVNNPKMHIYLGGALAGKGDFDGALKEFDLALRINPYDTEAYFFLGNCYYNKGDLEAAIQAFSDTLTLTPDYSDTHNKLGVALARMGDLDAAIQEFNKELSLKSANSDADKNLRQTLYLKMEQYRGVNDK